MAFNDNRLTVSRTYRSEIHKVPRKDIMSLVYQARDPHWRLQRKGWFASWDLTHTNTHSCTLLVVRWTSSCHGDKRFPQKGAQRPFRRWIHCRECGVEWHRRATAPSQEEMVLGLLWEITICRSSFLLCLFSWPRNQVLSLHHFWLLLPSSPQVPCLLYR